MLMCFFAIIFVSFLLQFFSFFCMCVCECCCSDGVFSQFLNLIYVSRLSIIQRCTRITSVWLDCVEPCMVRLVGWLVAWSVGRSDECCCDYTLSCCHMFTMTTTDAIVFGATSTIWLLTLYERWPRLKNNKHKTFGLRCHFFCFVLYITRKMSGFIFYTNASRVLLRWTLMRIAFIVYPTTRYAHRSCVFFRRYIFWIVCSFPKPALPMLCFVSHRSVSSSSCYRRV